MNTGPIIALTIGLVVLLVACVTVYTFRWITNRLGTGKLAKEGVILSEDGLEVPGFLFLNKKVICYSDVKAVELLSGFRSVLFLFNMSVHWICPRPFGDLVAIELKSPPQYYKYIVVAPNDPPVFVEQLKRRIKEA
jgi:hypothetical protein